MPAEFYNHYRNNGFSFSKSILTRYCLSLYTKPFVILSGISGTGKTKIAQLFRIPERQPEPAAPVGAPAPVGAAQRPYILLNVTNGIMGDDGRGNFYYNNETRNALWTAAELAEIDADIARLAAAGSADNVTDIFDIQIRDNENNRTINAGVYIQRAGNPLVRVRFKSKRGDVPAYNSTAYFRQFWHLGDVIRLERTGNKQFEIVRQNNPVDIQEVEGELIDNTCFVSVRSNWTDGTEIFGYYNSIEEKFVVGKVLRFILSAEKFPNHPFFLILDEMNLSKVENYFSDFLSCLESRVIVDGDFKQEKITLYSGTETIKTNDEEFDEISSSLEIPRNLYVTGTINVDESTYMFSPKVLDRANVIEFNEVDFESYGEAPPVAGEARPPVPPAPVPEAVQEPAVAPIQPVIRPEIFLLSFPPFGKVELAIKENFVQLDPESKKLFKDINDILKPYNLHFGYRVVNEMSLFLKNVKTYINDLPETTMWAQDVQIVQKILPKLNGSLGKLEEPLKSILKLLYPAAIAVELNVETLSAINAEESNYPLSIRKTVSMLSHLYQNGYANFIE